MKSNGLQAISFLKGLGVLLIVLLTTTAYAQLNPLGATYFQNQYLNNPAFAGLQKGLRVDMAYRQQWSVLPGAPKTQALSMDYQVKEKAGFGISIYSDQAGLLKQNRVMGSYAYHLPLSETQKLSFGISLGMMDQRVDYSKMDGDQGDISVGNFNQRETYMDGDFGLAYTSNNLTLQSSIPNMKSFFKKEDQNLSNMAQLFAAASYKFTFSSTMEGMTIEPKLCLRSIKGNSDIIDFGSNITIANGLANVQAIYHSSKNITLGMGAKYKSLLQINGIYTSGTTALQNESNGTFELNLKLNLMK